jgi:hypothetical protein
VVKYPYLIRREDDVKDPHVYWWKLWKTREASESKLGLNQDEVGPGQPAHPISVTVKSPFKPLSRFW